MLSFCPPAASVLPLCCCSSFPSRGKKRGLRPCSPSEYLERLDRLRSLLARCFVALVKVSRNQKGEPPPPPAARKKRRAREGRDERRGSSAGFLLRSDGRQVDWPFHSTLFFYPFSHTTVWRRCFAARCLRCSGDCSSCPIPLLPRQASISCGAARRGQRASPLSTDDCDGDIRIRSRHRPPPPLSPLLLRLRRHRGDQQPSRPQPLDEQQQQLLLLLSSKQHRPRSWTRQ